MNIKENLIKYCNYCLSDTFVNDYEDYISCKSHKLACKRFLNDIEREKDDDFKYYWCEEEAQSIYTWFTYLRHSKGVLAGQPIYLTLWQQFVVCQIYGWRNKEDYTRRFTKSFVEVGRKNSKSQIESGISLYEISKFSAENNHELMEAYCAGIKRDQSKIIFDEAKLMLNGSPLKTKFKITRDKITNKKSGSFLKPLAKEDAQKGDGTNPQLTVLDEFHLHADTGFYDMHTSGCKARKQPLLMIITTAGFDLSVPCYTQEYKYCKEILEDNVKNDKYFTDILELDKGDEITLKNIKKANPIVCSYKQGVDNILEDLKIANEIPEKMTAFLTKTCNIWLNKTDDGYMDMEKFKSCEINKLPYEKLKGSEVYIGIDISAKHDLTGVCFEIHKNGKYYIKTHSFIPNTDKLMEHKAKDKQPFDTWLREDYLSITDTPIVDQQKIIDYCLEECNKNGWEIRMFCVDPHNASKFMIDLSDNYDYEVTEVYQSKKSLNEATVDFREQVLQQNIVYEKNPCYVWQIGNAKVVKDNEGLIKIDKSMQRQRIDEVDATICSHKLAMYDEEDINVIDTLDDIDMY